MILQNIDLSFVPLSLILNPDIICSDNFFLNIKRYLQGNIDFSIIGSVYEEYTNYKPAGFFDNRDLKNAKFLKIVELERPLVMHMILNGLIG